MVSDWIPTTPNAANQSEEATVSAAHQPDHQSAVLENDRVES